MTETKPPRAKEVKIRLVGKWGACTTGKVYTFAIRPWGLELLNKPCWTANPIIFLRGGKLHGSAKQLANWELV